MGRRAEGAFDKPNAAFWLAPLVSTLPLIPFFSLPTSPLFLGKLGGDPAHPFLWPGVGPWLAAAAVIFDGTLLAYFVAVPVYWILKNSGKLSTLRVLLVFALAGVVASQLVHPLQDFRQPLLREFAISWLAPLFGCLCGLVSGAGFVFFARVRLSVTARVVAYALPLAILAACGTVLVWSSHVWRMRQAL